MKAKAKMRRGRVDIGAGCSGSKTHKREGAKEHDHHRDSHRIATGHLLIVLILISILLVLVFLFLRNFNNSGSDAVQIPRPPSGAFSSTPIFSGDWKTWMRMSRRDETVGCLVGYGRHVVSSMGRCRYVFGGRLYQATAAV
jgi:hypothetical protein